jgi:hypothetical protein
MILGLANPGWRRCLGEFLRQPSVYICRWFPAINKNIEFFVLHVQVGAQKRC